jgi:hypothetical protein
MTEGSAWSIVEDLGKEAEANRAALRGDQLIPEPYRDM